MKLRAAKPNLQGIEMPQSLPSTPQLQARIAEAAYYRAERRGFAPGGEIEDWLAAEAEVIARAGAGERVS
jgi:hypothetical protein